MEKDNTHKGERPCRQCERAPAFAGCDVLQQRNEHMGGKSSSESRMEELDNNTTLMELDLQPLGESGGDGGNGAGDSVPGRGGSRANKQIQSMRRGSRGDGVLPRPSATAVTGSCLGQV